MRMLLAAVAIALVFIPAACSTSADPDIMTTDLTNTAWRMAGEAKEAAHSSVVPTVRFGDDGQLSGDAGCNSFFGTWELDGSRLRVDELATTKKLCQPPEVMENEAAFLAALRAGGEITLQDGQLVISDQQATRPLRLIAEPR